MTDTEQIAWLWLMALPRVQIPAGVTGPRMREMWDRQIKIQACPGKLNTFDGAPLVRLSILLPGLKKRVTGTGNNLYSACDRAQQEARRAGVELPWLVVFNPTGDRR